MRILQICNKSPYPPNDGGAIAILNLSKTYADSGEQVTLLAMNTIKHYTDPASIPDTLSAKIKFIFVPVAAKTNLLKLIINFLFSSLPYTLEKFISKNFKKELKVLLQENDYDVIQLEGLYILPYLSVIRQFSNAKIVYRAHNIEHEIWHRVASSSNNPIKKLYFMNLSGRIANFERKIINSYDMLVPISEIDSKIFQRLGNTKPALVAPFGIPEEYFREPAATADLPKLFFIGSLDWIPNVDGLCWFIDKVWKKLKHDNPSLIFNVAGRGAPVWFKTMCSKEGIIFHGEIEDAKSFFDQNNIMIVPLFAGSGMRVKIIEAMSRSKVVVTTSVGAEGIDITSMVHAIKAENPEDFYKAITGLLVNTKFLKEIEKNAYALIRQKYSNRVIAMDLLNFYTQQTVC
jgi:polysaccharide biosynthesis protein PslH